MFYYIVFLLFERYTNILQHSAITSEIYYTSMKQNVNLGVRTGFGTFWKIMEIENAIFQDLESFRKDRIFKLAMEKFWIFVWKNSNHIIE